MSEDGRTILVTKKTNFFLRLIKKVRKTNREFSIFTSQKYQVDLISNQKPSAKLKIRAYILQEKIKIIKYTSL